MSVLDPQNESSENPVWHVLNRFLIVLITVTIATIVVYRYMPDLGARRDQQKRIEDLKADIDHEKQLLARYTREERLLKSDPEYIGLIARDRLDLMKEGETIYRMDAKPDTSKMRLNH